MPPHSPQQEQQQHQESPEQHEEQKQQHDQLQQRRLRQGQSGSGPVCVTPSQKGSTVGEEKREAGQHRAASPTQSSSRPTTAGGTFPRSECSSRPTTAGGVASSRCGSAVAFQRGSSMAVDSRESGVPSGVGGSVRGRGGGGGGGRGRDDQPTSPSAAVVRGLTPESEWSAVDRQEQHGDLQSLSPSAASPIGHGVEEAPAAAGLHSLSGQLSRSLGTAVPGARVVPDGGVSVERALERERRRLCAGPDLGPLPTWEFERLEASKSRPVGGRHTSTLVRPESRGRSASGSTGGPSEAQHRRQASAASRVRGLSRTASGGVVAGGVGNGGGAGATGLPTPKRGSTAGRIRAGSAGTGFRSPVAGGGCAAAKTLAASQSLPRVSGQRSGSVAD
eukprot:TRINITY_DN38902_c0_g1_i1.p1 TRINITY_DN38902_c0_g1~~TRINITY_DN38902_c0_g1_i1.p1  ORF type:complete len:445 (-),score=94.17 TRINITY_DN38902_c0_g1_i1:143-1315(-)